MRAGCWLLAVTALLAACSSEEPPGALPPVQESVSPSVGPMPVPSPSSLDFERTSRGASAFATFFLHSVGLAYQSADPRLIDELSAPECGGCKVLISGISELRDAGHRRVGGEYVVLSAVAPALNGGDTVVDVIYERPEAEILDQEGATVASAGPVASTTAQVRVLWQGDGWVVQGYRTFAP